jgi:CBS domain-containing protein
MEVPMKAADIMSTEIVSVGPDCIVSEVAGIFLKHEISAVPVLGQDGELLGMVSDGDLMRSTEGALQRRRSWWLTLLATRESFDPGFDPEYKKARNRPVSEVMTRRVITASPETPVSDIAARLDRYSIKRVPIVFDGKVVGVIGRADLVKAVAAMPKTVNEAAVVWG